MIEAFTVDQVRTAEQAKLSSLPEGELMRRASSGLAEVVRDRAVELDARRLVVLAGAGNNGGDALYAGARLSTHLGVVVVQLADTLHEAGLVAAESAGVPVHPVDPGATELPTVVVQALAGADLVLDGMLGIGGRAGLRGAMALAAEVVGDAAYVVAVDLPSGADPAGQEALTRAVFADETVTFGAAKPVHLLPATAPAVGRLTVLDIGLDLPGPGSVQCLQPADVPRLWPVPGPGDDKYSRGVVGVVAGGESYPGAAVLCTGAAAQAGAGMVRYVGPPTATGQVLHASPEVVPGRGRVQAWVLGPGVDITDASAEGRAQVQAIRDAMASDDACVLDAGALDLLTHRDAPTLLTPHAGELARLLGRLVEDSEVTRSQVQADPVRHARQAAELTGCTVLLKGSTTLVAPPEPGRPVRVQADAPSWLATAGAGDVLAGLAGTLLAAGLSPLEAGSLAALVHGVAGHRANPGGPVRAGSVSHAIPKTVAHLLRR